MFPGQDDDEDRMTDEYLSRLSGRSPALKPVITPDALAAEPNDAEPDADVDDNELTTYLDRTATAPSNKTLAYNPDQTHDSESWAQADATPRTATKQYGTEPDAISKGAIIASGIGSFLQRKPFDENFWTGREKRRDTLAHQGVADQERARIAALRAAELAQREDALSQNIADKVEQRKLGWGKLGEEHTRTGAIVTAADAKKADLEGKAKIAEAKANPNSNQNIALRESLYKDGIKRGSLEGLNEDQIRDISPHIGKMLDIALANQTIDIARRKAGAVAGAESDARFPNEEKLARIRGDISEGIAEKKRGTGDAGMDNEIAAIERKYGITIDEPTLYSAASRGRGRAQMVKDFQNQDQLGKASRDMLAVRDELAAGPQNGEDEDDFLVRLNSKYNFAKSKATAALVQLGGSESQSAIDHADSQWPAKLSPYAGPALKGAIEELDHVRQSKIGAYGGSVEARAPGASAEDQPITRSGLGDPIPTVAPDDRLPVTSKVGPKVSAVPGAAKPGPSIGKRNGKDVRAIKPGKKDGKPVRVVFYVDGSTEVVP